jgi:hypothetical protein
VCRSDVHSLYLVQNNCVEPKGNCANFEELENKLKEALVELRSGQLIIKFLQKELNTTLVLGSQHNHRYEVPLLNREAVNQQSLSDVSKQIKMDGSKPTQISLRNKTDMKNVGRNWPGNIIISSHFEPLSNFKATLDGNRNNPKLKSADFVDDGNVNQKTF